MRTISDDDGGKASQVKAGRTIHGAVGGPRLFLPPTPPPPPPLPRYSSRRR